MVLNFHGGTQNAAQQVRFSKMNETAEARGFIVVYPEGVNGVWDAGACCASQTVDDVGFARAIVEYMQEHACIDSRRIYSTGMSNGGRMSYRLGCEAADVFAAIAPVAGIKSIPGSRQHAWLPAIAAHLAHRFPGHRRYQPHPLSSRTD